MDEEYSDSTMDLDVPSGSFDMVETSTDSSDDNNLEFEDTSDNLDFNDGEDESIVDEEEFSEEDESIVDEEEFSEEDELIVDEEEFSEEDESIVEEEETPEEDDDDEEINEEDESIVEEEETPEEDDEDEETNEEDESIVEEEETSEEDDDEEINEEDESIVEEEETSEEDDDEEINEEDESIVEEEETSEEDDDDEEINEEDESIVDEEETSEEDDDEEINEEDESIVEEEETSEEEDDDEEINEEDESIVEEEETSEENDDDEEINEEDESIVEEEETSQEDDDDEEINEEDESIVDEEDEQIDFGEQEDDTAGFLFGRKKEMPEQQKYEESVEDDISPKDSFSDSLREMNANIEDKNEEELKRIATEETFTPKKFEHGDGERIRERGTDPRYIQDVVVESNKDDTAGFLFGRKKEIPEEQKHEESVEDDISPKNNFSDSLREMNANIEDKNEEELKRIATEETFTPKKFEHGDGERIRERGTDPRHIQDVVVENNKDDMQTFKQQERDNFEIQEFAENNEYENNMKDFQKINLDIYEECVKSEAGLEYGSGDRKEELDATRCTYAQEFRNQAEKAKNMENELQNRMSQIENDETQVDLYNKYKTNMENLKKEYEFCDNQANRLMQNVETKTEFVGVNGMNLSEIDSKFIKEQGNEVKHFKGTCGECSIANGINALGGDLTERQVVEYARNNNICKSQNYSENDYGDMDYIEKIKAEGTNGATDIADRRKIVNGLGYDFEVRYDESLDDIYKQMQKGKSPIMTVNADVLDKRINQRAAYTDENGITTEIPVKRELGNLRAVRKYGGINHAVTVKGIQLNDKGEAVGIWLHDTGNNSSTGNSCYITKDEYSKIIAAMPQSVEYISRRNKGGM